MQRIAFLGALDAAVQKMALHLHAAGYTVMFTHAEALEGADLPILIPTQSAALIKLSHSEALRRPWLAWNRSDRPALAAAAYQAGALAVLPARLTPNAFRQAVQRALDLMKPGTQAPLARRAVREYRRADPLLLEHNAVVEVQSGVIALRALHYDGAEVLLGLCGPGQTLVYHPADSCNLQLAAHTDAKVLIKLWAEAVKEPDFAARLRERLQQMEAWAAIQARPYLDQRVLGLLSLLAEQFGKPQAEGVLIDLRLTHAQLASATGATRTTITRTLGDLRTRGLLTNVGSGENERFLLRQRETGSHRP
ncbi:MAG: helix-turn-helix domain-containing protein [Anaerolineales bacterium]|nr:helix-turn-helix domain-containing protein [Anaerolineales bacterium]